MEQVEDELLVYDLDRNKAYCLNPTAAFIWKNCDGRTSAAAIARRLNGGKPGADEKLVWYALEQLGRDRLLESPVPAPAAMGDVTRRQHLRAWGKAAAMGLPLITAVRAPLAAAAASLIPNGGSCYFSGIKNKDCASNHCCIFSATVWICTATCGKNDCPTQNCNGEFGRGKK